MVIDVIGGWLGCVTQLWQDSGGRSGRLPLLLLAGANNNNQRFQTCLLRRARMPFLSQDWRGPGEDWVRGQDGWEIMRRGEVRGEGVKRRRTKTEGDKENTAPGRYLVHNPILLFFRSMQMRLQQKTAFKWVGIKIIPTPDFTFISHRSCCQKSGFSLPRSNKKTMITKKIGLQSDLESVSF